MSRYTLKHTISPLSWSRFAVVVIIVIIFSIIIIYSAGLFLYRCQFYWDWIPSIQFTLLSLSFCVRVFIFFAMKMLMRVMKRNKFLFSFAFVLLALASFSQYVSIAFSVVSNVSFTRLLLFHSVFFSLCHRRCICVFVYLREKICHLSNAAFIYYGDTNTHTHARNTHEERTKNWHGDMTVYDVDCTMYNSRQFAMCTW